MDASDDEFLVSDFAAAEVASALSRLVRMQELDREDAHQRLATFDAWLVLDATCVDLEPRDIRQAAALVRRFELRLRTPDALHVAICARLAASMVTRDANLAHAASAIGLATIPL